MEGTPAGTEATTSAGSAGSAWPARAALDAHYALSTDEQGEVGLAELSALRRAAWNEYVSHVMAGSPEARGLAIDIAERYGPYAVAHHNVVSWPVALFIGRYGEAIDHWPTTLTEDDLVRATEMANQIDKMPAGILPLGDVATARARFHNRSQLFGLEQVVT